MGHYDRLTVVIDHHKITRQDTLISPWKSVIICVQKVRSERSSIREEISLMDESTLNNNLANKHSCKDFFRKF